MQSRIGNLGGYILKAKQIRRLRGLLKQKGITLIVEGDTKAVTRQFLSAESFSTFEELVSFMRLNNRVGAFNAITKQFYLTASCTELVVFHEMAHLKHFEQLGELYFSLSKLEKETYVWEQILAQRSKWTEDEIQDALRYINDVRGKLKLEPIKLN